MDPEAPDETYGLFICNTRHGDRRHLTLDYQKTLCTHRARKPHALSNLSEEIEIPAAPHWIDETLCNNCLIERYKIIKGQTDG